MAQKFLKDLLLDGFNGVKPIETIEKKKGLGQQVKDVATAELDKNGPRVLFYKQLPSLYGSDLARISSKGSIDPARTLAVRGARYVDTNNAGGGRFARVLGNLLGGSANRPSDTIFPANDQGQGVASDPPVSINGQPINQNWNGLKYAVEAGQKYVVSQEPATSNALTGLLKGNPSDFARNAIGAATGTAKQAIGRLAVNALTSKRRTNIGDLKEKIKKSSQLESFGTLYNTPEQSGSSYIKVTNMLNKSELIDVKELGIKDRHYLIDNALLKEPLVGYKRLQSIIEQNTGNNLQFIKIKEENSKNYILFPATITDVQDNMTPEWNSFKYVGSPFNNYRYAGVERKIGFDFRVYWIDNGDQIVMQSKLNLLRELVYPNRNLTTINLTGTEYTPLVFKPNTIQLSIGDLFKNIKGFVSNLSITTPQDAPWATSNPNFLKENKNMVYPTFVDVSFEMTVIENHIIESNDTITYRFDDTNELEGNPVLPTQPVSSVPFGAVDYGYNDIKLKPQSQQAREIRRQADFANRMNVADIGAKGTIRWDANLK
jgi:curved DNA-binding protein CbpA